jgi:hypothetical protein
VVIVKKTSPDYRPGVDPPCPSVAVNGRIVVRDGTLEFEALKAELER